MSDRFHKGHLVKQKRTTSACAPSPETHTPTRLIFSEHIAESSHQAHGDGRLPGMLLDAADHDALAPAKACRRRHLPAGRYVTELTAEAPFITALPAVTV